MRKLPRISQKYLTALSTIPKNYILRFVFIKARELFTILLVVVNSSFHHFFSLHSWRLRSHAPWLNISEFLFPSVVLLSINKVAYMHKHSQLIEFSSLMFSTVCGFSRVKLCNLKETWLGCITEILCFISMSNVFSTVISIIAVCIHTGSITLT